MSETVALRRHLYEQYAALRLRDRRQRRRLRRQIALLAAPAPAGGGRRTERRP